MYSSVDKILLVIMEEDSSLLHFVLYHASRRKDTGILYFHCQTISCVHFPQTKNFTSATKFAVFIREIKDYVDAARKVISYLFCFH